MVEKNTKILVIDDDPEFLKQVINILEDTDYQILSTSSGIEGLRIASSELPDVILLDIILEDINGYRILEHIKERKISTRVIMLTVLNDIDNILYFIKSGAVDYLVKPINKEKLINTINLVLETDHPIIYSGYYNLPIINDLSLKINETKIQNRNLMNRNIQLGKEKKIKEAIIRISYLIVSFVSSYLLFYFGVLTQPIYQFFMIITLFFLLMLPIDKIKKISTELFGTKTDISLDPTKNIEINQLSYDMKVLNQLGMLVSQIIHELNVPVQSINHAVSLLEKDPENKELVEFCKSHVKFMNDFLDKLRINYPIIKREETLQD